MLISCCLLAFCLPWVPNVNVVSGGIWASGRTDKLGSARTYNSSVKQSLECSIPCRV